jgi:lysophospholipase L1-like esterase
MGDSITDWWGRDADHGTFFPGKPYVNRGISGQTTAQMLVRFRADVVALKPRAVVILAGTNDIAGNTGAATDAMIEDNVASMCEIAVANGIRVAIASILPVNERQDARATQARPPARIRAINDWLRAYAATRRFAYIDYHAAMAGPDGLLRAELSDDGLHPNTTGYAVMAPLAQRAIDQALR